MGIGEWQLHPCTWTKGNEREFLIDDTSFTFKMHNFALENQFLKVLREQAKK